MEHLFGTEAQKRKYSLETYVRYRHTTPCYLNPSRLYSMLLIAPTIRHGRRDTMMNQSRVS